MEPAIDPAAVPAVGPTVRPAARTAALALDGIQKHFGGIRALDGVKLELHAGEVLALLGENGAGKSTAVKIMTGIYRPDAGTIRVAGSPVELTSTQAAWHHGIAAVYQETVMFDELSVAENIFMGHLATTRRGWLDWGGMKRRAAAILASLESDLRPDTPLGQLSVAQKHLVEIARALSHDARVVIMDEHSRFLEFLRWLIKFEPDLVVCKRAEYSLARRNGKEGIQVYGQWRKLGTVKFGL